MAGVVHVTVARHVAICALLAAVTAVLFVLYLQRVLGLGRRGAPRGGGAAAACTHRRAKLWTVGGERGQSFAVWVRCGAVEGPWVVDTGFGGAPVLALPWLARQRDNASAERCAEVYAATAKRLGDGGGGRGARRALRDFQARTGARAFTAGCTNTFLGIGSAATSTTDMLLAPPLEVWSAAGGGFSSPRTCVSGGLGADVLGTTEMATAPLLTCDWLRQNGPCLLSPATETLQLALDDAEALALRDECFCLASELSAGAFVASVRVAGVSVRLTVDTGSALTIAVSGAAARRIARCSATRPARLTQTGVNGEAVCADVVACSAEVEPGRPRDVPVFVQDAEADDVDGYMGTGLLADYDLLVFDREIWARRTRADEGRDIDEWATALGASDGWCGGAPPACLG